MSKESENTDIITLLKRTGEMQIGVIESRRKINIIGLATKRKRYFALQNSIFHSFSPLIFDQDLLPLKNMESD